MVLIAKFFNLLYTNLIVLYNNQKHCVVVWLSNYTISSDYYINLIKLSLNSREFWEFWCFWYPVKNPFCFINGEFKFQVISALFCLQVVSISSSQYYSPSALFHLNFMEGNGVGKNESKCRLKASFLTSLVNFEDNDNAAKVDILHYFDSLWKQVSLLTEIKC